MMTFRRTIFYTFMVLMVSSMALAQNRFSIEQLKDKTDDGFNFIIATDLGRNGYYDQKYIGNTMGEVAGECDAEFVAATGDTFHYLGVQSVQDPLFISNFESVYPHPELQIPWYPILGNHEYHGNTQAVIDYSQISRRWEMPSRYYVKHFELDNDELLDIFFIDTCPLIDKYVNDSEYPDAAKQNRSAQLKWLDEQLSKSKAQYKIVVGHHPIYADTSKNVSERLDMQKHIDPLLRKYGVNLYSAGHIHNFQHIKLPSSDVHYMVVSSGSLSRNVAPIEGTQFCNSNTGFAFVSVKDGKINVYFLDKDANILYEFVANK